MLLPLLTINKKKKIVYKRVYKENKKIKKKLFQPIGNNIFLATFQSHSRIQAELCQHFIDIRQHRVTS